jgi:hypothetical protein
MGFLRSKQTNNTLTYPPVKNYAFYNPPQKKAHQGLSKWMRNILKIFYHLVSLWNHSEWKTIFQYLDRVYQSCVYYIESLCDQSLCHLVWQHGIRHRFSLSAPCPLVEDNPKNQRHTRVCALGLKPVINEQGVFKSITTIWIGISAAWKCLQIELFWNTLTLTQNKPK